MYAPKQCAARVITSKAWPQHQKSRCWQLPAPQIFFTVPERILLLRETEVPRLFLNLDILKKKNKTKTPTKTQLWKRPNYSRIQVANQDKHWKGIRVLNTAWLLFEEKGKWSCNIYLCHFNVPGPNNWASHKDMPTAELVLDKMNESKLWMYYGIPEEQLLKDWEADWDILVDRCPTSPCNDQLLQIKFFSAKS